jgi:hypothetical protein
MSALRSRPPALAVINVGGKSLDLAGFISVSVA